MFVMFERGSVLLAASGITLFPYTVPFDLNFNIEIGTSTATASRHAMNNWILLLDHTGALCIVTSDEMMDCSHRDQERSINADMGRKTPACGYYRINSYEKDLGMTA